MKKRSIRLLKEWSGELGTKTQKKPNFGKSLDMLKYWGEEAKIKAPGKPNFGRTWRKINK